MSSWVCPSFLTVSFTPRYFLLTMLQFSLQQEGILPESTIDNIN